MKRISSGIWLRMNSGVLSMVFHIIRFLAITFRRMRLGLHC